MAYVITSPCIGVCDTACVDVCPMDCIHPKKEDWPGAGIEEGNLGGKMLFIDPSGCTDCSACEPACPVQAIFPDDEVPESEQKFVSLNAEHFI